MTGSEGKLQGRRQQRGDGLGKSLNLSRLQFTHRTMRVTTAVLTSSSL